MIELHNDCLKQSGKKRDCPVSEKGKTFRLISKKDCNLWVYKVDACLIKDGGQKKCDYLILLEGDSIRHAYFVELKGTGLRDAINQIDNSVKILIGLVNKYKIFGRIVGRKVTPNIKSRRVKLDEKLRQLGGNLIIASTNDYREEV
jgi:hypothetical protein